MKGERNLMMTTVFLRIARWLRILIYYGLQFIQHVIRKLSNKRVDQIKLKMHVLKVPSKTSIGLP